MSSISVSVVVPLRRPDSSAAIESISAYLESTGFTFELLTPPCDEYGPAIRRAVSDAKGAVIVIVDDRLPYPLSAIGDAVAMIESGSTDAVYATTAEPSGTPLLRWLLVPLLPDPAILLSAFSSTAAKITIGESRLPDHGCELEVAFLANKYGFRVEHLLVHQEGQARNRSFGWGGGLAAAFAVRIANRKGEYRAARRCPVCFSPEVWSCAQIPGNVVRACRRCKCRYLNRFTEDETTSPVRRLLRPQIPAHPPSYEAHSAPARERTSARRFNWVRRQIPPRARILEVGVRDGSFGTAAAREYEYVGIDPASAAARHARARGLEVYCASLSSFVNTGPAFDAITLFHVFENMADPHDALARIKDLLKPGGVLFLSALDTEGLIYLLSENQSMAQNFRTHVILYSRSALIELLEHSGYEILDIGPDFEYRDRRFLRHWFASRHPLLAPFARLALKVLPDPMIVSTGSIRLVAKRRSGQPLNTRTIRSVEPTHAR